MATHDTGLSTRFEHSTEISGSPSGDRDNSISPNVDQSLIRGISDKSNIQHRVTPQRTLNDISLSETHEIYEKNRAPSASLVKDLCYYNAWFVHFGDVKLSEITIVRQNDFINMLGLRSGRKAKRLSQKSIKNYFTYLRKISRNLVRNRITNELLPVRKIEDGFWTSPILTPLAAKSVLNQAKFEKHKNLRLFLILSYFTGSRRQELSRLRWTDINFEDNTITVPRSLRTRPEYRRPTLPLTPELKLELLDAYARKNGDFVLNNYGRPINDLKRSFGFLKIRAIKQIESLADRAPRADLRDQLRDEANLLRQVNIDALRDASALILLRQNIPHQIVSKFIALRLEEFVKRFDGEIRNTVQPISSLR